MPKVDRRTSLKGSLVAAGATFAIGVTGREVLGANDVINVGCAGIRGRGSGHMSSFLGMKECRLTWLVDIDASVLELNGNPIKPQLP